MAAAGHQAHAAAAVQDDDERARGAAAEARGDEEAEAARAREFSRDGIFNCFGVSAPKLHQKKPGAMFRLSLVFIFS
jgi:hypothetical protein